MCPFEEDDTKSNLIARTRVALDIAGMNTTIARRDIAYRPGERDSPTLEIRYPSASARRGHLPAIVFVTGYSDAGVESAIGCKQKDMQSYVSWSKLAAASGIAAITYASSDPATDVQAVLGHVARDGLALGLDPQRIGVWACSGNVPNALSVLMRKQGDRVKCAVLCYGFMLDDEGCPDVSEAARAWGFANSSAGRRVDDLPETLPLFVARAGLDETRGVNESIDRFMTQALSRNRPVTLVNVPDAPHAFDVVHDTESSREAIRSMLAFLRFHLRA